MLFLGRTFFMPHECRHTCRRRGRAVVPFARELTHPSVGGEEGEVALERGFFPFCHADCEMPEQKN